MEGRFISMIIFKEKQFSPGFRLSSRMRLGRLKAGGVKRKANELAWKMKLNPRETIKKGIVEGTAKTIENPDLVLANTVGTAAQVAALSKIDPALAAASMTPGVPGIGTLYTAARVKVGGTPKILKTAADKVRSSKGYGEAINTALGKQPKAYVGLPSRQSAWDKIKYNIKSGAADISNTAQGAGKSILKTVTASETDNNMKIFKEKQYTLQEGHYTGPKDLEEVPGIIKTVGGATLAGYAVGAVADEASENSRKPVLGDEPTSWKTRGAQAGFVAGIIGKLLLNSMHNPMSEVKFQELDKALRRSFGMYQAGGFTVGDSRENREKMKESFVINSKNLTDFKIIVSVAKGKLMMYTLGLSEKQEEDLNDILDYYCKKYYGMKYTSTRIGSKSGSWSINIVFTNHQIAANFLIEVRDVLSERIDFLNADISEEIKTFSSVPYLDKVELKNIFSRGILKLASSKFPMDSWSLIDMVTEGLGKVRTAEAGTIGIKEPRENYGNKFLETTLKKLDPSGRTWTVGENGSNLNIYLFSGTLMICASYGSKEESLVGKIQGLKDAKKTTKTSASFWTYTMKSPGDLEVMIKKLMSLGVTLNLYIP